MKTVRVVAAVIKAVNDKKEPIIFATQRGYGEFKDGWEFPGGKIEPQETPEACIVREIKEELQVTAQVERFLGIAVYAYPDFVLELYVFVLTLLLASEPVLIEHSAGAWRTALELSKLPWDECDSLFVPLLKDYHPF